MNARILTTATLALALTAILPAKAADSQLMNLVMPDARVLAGVNVEQAKGTQFGQYLLNLVQANAKDLQELYAKTGFDPTRDVREVLVASNASTKNGIFLGIGTFDVGRISTLATDQKAQTEQYKGVTILEDPKGTVGVAFLSSSIVVAGDVVNVKGAIDRLTSPAILPAALMVKVNQWSLSQDAWVVSTVPTSQVQVPAGVPNIPGLGNNALQNIQSAAAGIKLGALIVVKAEVQADTAPNAQAMGDAVKMLASLAMLQNNVDPKVKQLVQSLTVATQGATLTLTVSMPQDQLQQIVRPASPNPAPAARRVERKM
jgi:hypothetical protein